MTVTEAMTDVFEGLGEPTELEFASGGVGNVPLRRGLEQAIIATMRYKDPRGRRLKWAGSTKQSSVVGGSPTTLTVVSTSGPTITVSASAANDFYLEWVAEFSGQSRRVVWSSGTSLALTEEFSTMPTAGETFTVRPSYLVLSSTTPVLSVRDTTTGTALQLVRPEDLSWDGQPSLGDPTSYFHLNGRLYVEPIPATERYFLLEVEQYPTLDGVADDDELPIPEPLHYAVVAWTMAWGFGRYMNPEMRRAMRREWQEILLTTQLPEDNITDRTDDRFTLEVE